MPTPLVGLLAAHLTRRGLPGVDSDEFMLAMPEGGPLVYQNFRNRHWLPACRAVGVEGLGFRDLRRLNAAGLVMEGVDAKTAQSQLGALADDNSFWIVRLSVASAARGGKK